jgi:hypothetical protein
MGGFKRYLDKLLNEEVKSYQLEDGGEGLGIDFTKKRNLLLMNWSQN